MTKPIVVSEMVITSALQHPSDVTESVHMKLVKLTHEVKRTFLLVFWLPPGTFKAWYVIWQVTEGVSYSLVPCNLIMSWQLLYRCPAFPRTWLNEEATEKSRASHSGHYLKKGRWVWRGYWVCMIHCWVAWVTNGKKWAKLRSVHEYIRACCRNLHVNRVRYVAEIEILARIIQQLSTYAWVHWLIHKCTDLYISALTYTHAGKMNG